MAFRGKKVTYYSHSKHFKVSFKTGEGQGEQGRVTCVACRASSTVLLEVAPPQKQVPQRLDCDSQLQCGG